MDPNHTMLVATLLFLGAILASAAAGRIGAPLLLVFLALGMLAGEDGPGGIRFDDDRLAFLVGNFALAIILLDGGLRTRMDTFRVALRPALSLATVGVALTAGITGAFARWILDLTWAQSLLVGAIVGSTDAAAVFSLLHQRGIELKNAWPPRWRSSRAATTPWRCSSPWCWCSGSRTGARACPARNWP